MADIKLSAKTETSTSTGGFLYIIKSLVGYKISIANLFKTTAAVIFGGQVHSASLEVVFSASQTFNMNSGNIQEMPVSASTTIEVSNLQFGVNILHLPVTVGTSPTITIGTSLGTKYTTSADLVNANGDENTVTVIKYPSGSIRYTISNIVA